MAEEWNGKAESQKWLLLDILVQLKSNFWWECKQYWNRIFFIYPKEKGKKVSSGKKTAKLIVFTDGL